MKKFLIVLLAFLFVASGCQKEGFTVASARLRQTRTDDVRTLEFGFFPSVDREDYALTIKSPDGNLEWKGNLERRESGEYVASLAITPGLDFPKGDWSFLIYSGEGSESEGVVNFPGAVDLTYDLEWPMLSWSQDGEVRTVVDGVEATAGSPVDLTNVTMVKYIDENFNEYIFTVNQ